MFYSEADVKQVDVSTTTGSFGILPSHVPTLATLRPGLLTVHDESGATKYFGKYSTICHCAVPEKVPYPPHGKSLEILGGGWYL